ncbi:MAG: hypothetical protein NC453_30505 [Muribaculum sp.]|nr:hypothetical protein [Muribaculum sp.]
MDRNVTFDRLRLSLPNECITIIDRTAFNTTLSGDDVVTCMRYEQKQPFYYSILCNPSRNVTYVEFSGKALLEQYPELISASNITTCFDNINRYNVCYIDPDAAMQNAVVCQCDVTRDVDSSYRVRDIIRNLYTPDNRHWAIKDRTENQFSIENTAVTPRKKIRLTVYDKDVEFSRSVNEPFIQSVSNPDYQASYFANKIRLELKLNSLDRIRRYFNVYETSLSGLLNADVDPIECVLLDAIVSDGTINAAKSMTASVRELEHLLLIAFAGYDMAKVESIIRDMSSPNRSIKEAMSPYVRVMDKLSMNDANPTYNLTLTEIKSYLNYMVSVGTSSQAESSDPTNLLYIYKKHNNTTITSQNQYEAYK